MTRTLIGSALVGMLLSSGASLYAAGDAAKGKELYDKRCKSCHADDGAGNAMLKKRNTPALGSAAIQGKSDADLKKAVKEGPTHKMSAKALTDADVDNLLAHVRSLKK